MLTSRTASVWLSRYANIHSRGPGGVDEQPWCAKQGEGLITWKKSAAGKPCWLKLPFQHVVLTYPYNIHQTPNPQPKAYQEIPCISIHHLTNYAHLKFTAGSLQNHSVVLMEAGRMMVTFLFVCLFQIQFTYVNWWLKITKFLEF